MCVRPCMCGWVCDWVSQSTADAQGGTCSATSGGLGHDRRDARAARAGRQQLRGPHCHRPVHMPWRTLSKREATERQQKSEAQTHTSIDAWHVLRMSVYMHMHTMAHRATFHLCACLGGGGRGRAAVQRVADRIHKALALQKRRQSLARPTPDTGSKRVGERGEGGMSQCACGGNESVCVWVCQCDRNARRTCQRRSVPLSVSVASGAGATWPSRTCRIPLGAAVPGASTSIVSSSLPPATCTAVGIGTGTGTGTGAGAGAGAGTGTGAGMGGGYDREPGR
jgi:hypothetical protein